MKNILILTFAILLQISYAQVAVYNPQVENPINPIGLDNTHPMSHAQMTQDGFKNPASDYRPKIFWTWMHDMVTKKGITDDLESFKKFGLSGTMIMIIGEADGRFNPLHNIKDPIKPMSPEFFDAWKFAAEESDRLGLDIISQCGPGWTHSGGPWIKPYQAIQKIVFSERRIRLETETDIKLLLSYLDNNKTGNEKEHEYVLSIPGGKDFTQDIGIIAFPVSESLSIKDVIAITDKYGQDEVKARLPKGEWVFVRYAVANKNALNRVAPAGAIGLECDKLDKDAVIAMYEGFVGRFISQSPDLAGKVIKGMEADSWEQKNPEWSTKFSQEFINRRGYDPLPWLVFFKDNAQGKEPELIERFKNDVYITQNEVIADNFFSTLYDLLDPMGVNIMTEPYEAPFDPIMAGGRVHVPMGEYWLRGDRMHTIRWASSSANTYGRNIVAAEAFTGRGSSNLWEMDPYGMKRMGDLAFCNGVNQNILHHTALQPWGDKVKPGMGMGFWGTMFQPGQTWWESGKAWTDYLSRCQYMLSQGTNIADIIYFMPSLDWNKAIPTGLHKLYNYDVATEELLLQGMDWQDGYFILPSGARYRVLVLPKTEGKMEPEIISKLTELAKKGGVIICQDRPFRSASLADYPKRDAMVQGEAAKLWGEMDGEKIKENIVGEGKIVWINDLYSHKDDPETKWAHRKFAEHPFYATPAHTNVWSQSFIEILKKQNIEPDVQVSNQVRGKAMMWGGIEESFSGYRTNEDAIGWTHRKVGKDDVYFISNQTADAIKPEITFRVAQKEPEIWNPETGDTYKIDEFTVESGKTSIHLNLSPFGSLFVVFKENSTAEEVIPAYDKFESQISLDGDWVLKFPKGWGAPEQIISPLKSLVEFEEPNIKYFSGSVNYSYEIELKKNELDNSKRKWINLGEVKNIAEVMINGKEVATLWKPPYSINISDELQLGKNLIEIKVTNTWHNRLVGDEQQPDDCEWGPLQYNWHDATGYRILRIPDWVFDGTQRPSKERYTFTTWKHVESFSPLTESGLIGPVSIKISN
jgi:hypothetical protein